MSLPASIAHLFEPYVPESDYIPPMIAASQSEDWRMPNGMAQVREAMGDDCCSLCGKAMDFECTATDPRRPTFEHVIPRSKGGQNVRNRLIAHKDCNGRKQSNMPTGCELIRLQVVNARLHDDPALIRRPKFRPMDQRKAIHQFWFSHRRGTGVTLNAVMVQAIAPYLASIEDYHATTKENGA